MIVYVLMEIGMRLVLGKNCKMVLKMGICDLWNSEVELILKGWEMYNIDYKGYGNEFVGF